MAMFYQCLVILLFTNYASPIDIDKNDVSCSADGSVNVKKTALGNLADSIYAFGGGGPYMPCHRQVREDVVTFERPSFDDSPVRMIIDDVSRNFFHVLDVRCTIAGTDDRPLNRSRRAGLYRNEAPERDSSGKLKVGAEVNNTGLDAKGNLVRDRDFKVDVGMTVNVPFSDNEEIDIECRSSSMLALSNPDPELFHYIMAYDRKGKLCLLSVKVDRSWVIVKNCDTNGEIKVAFNDREFVQGVIGGKSVLKVYKINCGDILRKELFGPLTDEEPEPDMDYYYVYEYPNSAPGRRGTMKQVRLLIMCVVTLVFLKRRVGLW